MLEDENKSKESDNGNLNKKITNLEAQLKDKSEKYAIKMAEYKKLEEIAG